MSEVIVSPAEITEILPHPNADNLEIAVIRGWQTVVRKDLFTTGQLALYIPPDAMIPKPLAELWGVDGYLSWRGEMGRVRSARLRGEPSHGFMVPCDNLAAALGIEKWQPALVDGKYGPKMLAAEFEPDHPQFPAYTHIENYRNYPDILQLGVPVVVTEKIHGTNSRIGRIRMLDGEGDLVARTLVGTHHRQFKPDAAGTTYHEPLTLCPQLTMLLDSVLASRPGATSAVLYGEVYGGTIQDLAYGLKQPAYLAFDLMVNGEYLEYDDFEAWCDSFDVPTAPVLYSGPWDSDLVKPLINGPTTLNGGPCIREGVVIRPFYKRNERRFGRVILKWVGDQYLCRKGGTELN